MPNKTDALVYMDGKNVTEPTRYARAILDVRATEHAYFQEILVGPLPLVNGTTSWKPLDIPGPERQKDEYAISYPT
jgi:primary-amine oxidase